MLTTTDNLAPILLGVGLVVGGLLLYGLRDLRRFSLVRTWAVSSLTFREGVRRRVLWTVPLAMAAAIAMIALADPSDERQAIAQAIRSLLFASGLMAVLVPLILGCTSFPREIENRVLYGVVTKPLTRLELLLGKVIGLARLSGVVLIGMGLFSAAVLLVVQARLLNSVERRLEASLVDEGRRVYLGHLLSDGLLNVASEARPDDVQVYAVPTPAFPNDYAGPRYFPPDNYYAAYRFRFPVEEATQLAELCEQGVVELAVNIRLNYQLLPGTLPPDAYPLGIQNLDALPEPAPPRVGIDIRDFEFERFIPLNAIPDNVGTLSRDGLDAEWAQSASIPLVGSQAAFALNVGAGRDFHVGVWGRDRAFQYGAGPGSVRIEVVGVDGFGPYYPEIDPATVRSDVRLRSQFGSGGQGLRGPSVESGRYKPTGAVAFRGVDVPSSRETVGFEIVADAEQDGSITNYLATAAEAGVKIRAVASDGRASDWQDLVLDTGAPGYVEFPSELVADGDFDLQLQTTADDRIVSIAPAGVRLTGAGEPFAWSFAKALAGQWLLSILVATVALVLGVFMSWPVALVLTLSILVGRATVQAAGEADGRDAVNELYDAGGGDDSSAAMRRVVERGYDALFSGTELVAKFLPETGVFDLSSTMAAREPVAGGDLLRGLGVLAGYGLPFFAGGYVVLRRKEVAS